MIMGNVESLENKCAEYSKYYQDVQDIFKNKNIYEKTLPYKFQKKIITGKGGAEVYIVSQKKKKYILKIFPDEIKKNINEAGISNMFTYLLKDKVIKYDYFPKVKEYGNLLISNKIKNYMIINYISGKSLVNFKNKEIYFQILHALYLITQICPSFRHNDLHANNILVIPIKKPFKIYFNEKVYTIKKYKIKIIDFGLSSLYGKVRPALQLFRFLQNTDIVFWNLLNKDITCINIKKCLQSTYFDELI